MTCLLFYHKIPLHMEKGNRIKSKGKENTYDYLPELQ